MMTDPPIDEIRELRHRMSEECGHDPKRFVRYLQQLEQQYRTQIQMFEDLQENAGLVVREPDAPYQGR